MCDNYYGDTSKRNNPSSTPATGGLSISEKAKYEGQIRELKIKNASLLIDNLILSIKTFPDMVHFLQPELKRLEEVLDRQEGRNRR